MVWSVVIVAAISKFIGLFGGNALHPTVLVLVVRWLLIIVAVWTVFYFRSQVK